MPKTKTLVSAFAAILLMAGTASADELAKYDVVDMAIPTSLTGKAGDAAAGEKVFINRKLGNCLACHQGHGTEGATVPWPDWPNFGRRC